MTGVRSPILEALAEKYEASRPGLRGIGSREVQPLLDELIENACCREGESYHLAIQQLHAAARAGVIRLEYDHPRARTAIHKVRLGLAQEQGFYQYIGRESPTARRRAWSALFLQAESWSAPARWSNEWRAFCRRRTESALRWEQMQPFRRDELANGRELLGLVIKLLAWQGTSLVRWASSLLCGDSKRLERQQTAIEFILADVTRNVAPTLVSLGILPMPRHAFVAGPLRLRFETRWQDIGMSPEGRTLSEAEIHRADEIICEAQRCLTIENKTPFQELARLSSGELLIHTSYANAATLALLRRLAELPSPPQFWHFGDADPKGFHILYDLRARSGIPIRALHMQYRPLPSATPLTAAEMQLLDVILPEMPEEAAEIRRMLAAGVRGDFEQESLRPPPLATWPFYPGQAR